VNWNFENGWKTGVLERNLHKTIIIVYEKVIELKEGYLSDLNQIFDQENVTISVTSTLRAKYVGVRLRKANGEAVNLVCCWWEQMTRYGI